MPLFTSDRKPFDDRVLQGKSVNELLEARILPDVPGLFADGPTPDAILLSHAHMDHTGFLGRTRPEIPVFATTGTSKMMMAGGIFARQEEIPKGRHRKLASGDRIQIGELQVTTFAVDHSVYGSSAFLIEAGSKSILYSGDLRLHGRKAGMAKMMIAALKNRNVDVFLMEGTLLGSKRSKSMDEYQLQDVIAEYVSAAEGLVLASFSPQHVDRLVGFIKACQRTHRVFVADVYTAYVLHLIKNETKTPPPITSEGIRVFYPQYFLASYERRGLRKIHDMFLADRIALDEILAAPSTYAMVFLTSMVDSDFEGTIPPRSCCLFSRWEGYLDQPEWQMAKEKIETAGGSVIHVHTSGHAFAQDIRNLVNEISPEMTIPMHTFNPEVFQGLFDNVVMIEDGETLEV